MTDSRSPSLRQLNLPLIAIVTFNILPAVQLRPLWSTAFCGALLAYRFWLEWSQAEMPPRVLRVLVQLSSALAVWQHYGTLFGDEAAGTFLGILTCQKLYELRTRRDYFVTATLGFLVLMSDLLLDQSLFMTFFLLADVLLLMTFLFSLETGKWSWRGVRGLKPALWLAVKALPLMAVVFFLFPRFSTGFGTGTSTAAKMGISDQLRPGSLTKLIGSDELVFRATFLNNRPPPLATLYWRSAILDVSRGLEWDRSRGAGRTRLPAGDDPSVEIYMEPGFERFLYSLEDTGTLGFPSEVRVNLREGRVFELDRPLLNRERYVLYENPKVRSDGEEPERYLAVGSRLTPELNVFVNQMRRATTSATVGEILRYFRANNFVYSLEPPVSTTVEQFVLRNKEGFCEHYAGSMATILRHLRIPARVVVGFRGGTPSLLENYISVRAHDAHAWVEYYDEADRRWRRTDPTDQVDPRRQVAGQETLKFQKSYWMEFFPDSMVRLYLRSGALVDEVDAAWTGFLLRFDLARQKEMLAKLGMEGVLFRALPLFLILSVVLVLAILYYFEAQKRETLSEDEALYRLFLDTLRRRQIVKPVSEGPLGLMARIAAVRPDLVPIVTPIMTDLVAIRFAGRAVEPEEFRSLRRRIRRI